MASALGDDIATKLSGFVSRWARSAAPGIVILTGNAGTGKTAIAEAYCKAAGGELPESDELVEVASGQHVIKDLSGLPNAEARARTLRLVLSHGESQTLICANEGVLRDAFGDVQVDSETAGVLEAALRSGAAASDGLTIVNVNRQRPTGDRMWNQVLDYVTREDLWAGCDGCPSLAGGCPMRSNAEQLRRADVREQLRTLVRLASGEAVPTLREVLAILAWAIVGSNGCDDVKAGVRDLGESAFVANEGYFTRLLGGGLEANTAERSPLLIGLRRSGLGRVSDLEVDGWLRDASGATEAVRRIAGDPHVTRPDLASERLTGLAGSLSPLDRVRTAQGEMTFHALGEMVSTDEDPTRVEDGLTALVRGDGATNVPVERLWRQRVYFEAAEELGGSPASSRRLINFRHVGDLLTLASKASVGGDTVIELSELIRGLNFLVTGFSSPNEGLIVPDPACLFARDPGSFRPARPSLVHSQVQIDDLALRVPDRGLVEEVLDIDHVEIELVVRGDDGLVLRIGPRMYEAIREAAAYRGPVGQGVAEMNDLRGFYGRLATQLEATDQTLRVADPDSTPPALVTISLPHFTARRGAR